MIDAPTFSTDVVKSTEFGRDARSGLLSTLAAQPGSTAGWWRDLPWSLRATDDSIELHLEHLQEEAIDDPANREFVVACGALLLNLRLAARNAEWELDVEHWPDAGDPSFVARARLAGRAEPSHEEGALFGVLSRSESFDPRRTAGPFSPAMVAVLRHAARTEGGWVDVIADDARREMVGDLASRAELLADCVCGARRLVTPVRRGVADTLASPVLMRRGAPIMTELMTVLGSNVMPGNEWSERPAVHVRSVALEAPVLLVLGACDDTPEGWLLAGAALQRMLLHASAQGVTATFINEPLQHPLLRDALQEMLFAGGAPQAIVRLDFDSNASVDTPARASSRVSSHQLV